jgi:nucleotide-binding universal stress UspA family protein
MGKLAPIVIFRGHAMHEMVVGYDGTESSARAVVEAATLAKALHSQFHLVHVVDDDALRQGMITSSALAKREVIAKTISDELLASDEILLKLTENTVINRVLRGPAAVCLVDYAVSVNADVIVLGNRRVKGIARVLGSVSIDVLRHAPCSVYVVETMN